MSSPTGCPIVAGGNALGIAVENMLCAAGALQIGGRALTEICAFLSHGKVEASDSETLFEMLAQFLGVPFQGVEFCVRRPTEGVALGSYEVRQAWSCESEIYVGCGRA